MQIQFVKFDRLFLELSWKWLNDSEIRELTCTPVFTKEDQEEWFKSLDIMTDYKIYGVKADNIPIGVCGIKNLTNEDCEYWGYVGDKSFWGRGIGKQLISKMEEIARNYGLKSVWLKVSQTNVRARNLYSKMSHILYKTDKGMLYMRKDLY